MGTSQIDYWVEGNEQWPDDDQWESRPFHGPCVYCGHVSCRYVEHTGLLFKRKRMICVFCGVIHPDGHEFEHTRDR